ncbi:uncharacterized [Tachysurus ichikawai]
MKNFDNYPNQIYSPSVCPQPWAGLDETQFVRLVEPRACVRIEHNGGIVSCRAEHSQDAFFPSQEILPFGVFIKDGCCRTDP